MNFDLNSREISIAVWTGLLAVPLLGKREIRRSLWQVVVHALTPKLAWVWLSLGAYAAAIVVLLQSVGVWDGGLFKSTLVWFGFSAIAYPFQFAKASDEPRVVRTLLKDGISVLIIVEALVDTYTFSLPVELVLVPLVTLVALVSVLGEHKPEYRQAAAVTNFLQGVFGLWIAAFAVQAAIGDPDRDIARAVYEVVLPVVLSLGMLPYIFWLRFTFAYEDFLWRFGRRNSVPKRFRHYAAAKIMWHLRFRPTSVCAFLRRNGLKLHTITNRDSLLELLRNDR